LSLELKVCPVRGAGVVNGAYTVGIGEVYFGNSEGFLRDFPP